MNALFIRALITEKCVECVSFEKCVECARSNHGEIGMCTILNLALEIPVAVKTDLPLFKKYFKMCEVCAASLVKVVHITQIWVKWTTFFSWVKRTGPYFKISGGPYSKVQIFWQAILIFK